MERVQAVLKSTSDKAAQERCGSGCSWVLSVQDAGSPADLETEKVEFCIQNLPYSSAKFEWCFICPS